ncbi:unnamed protein product, partial [Staurois parvus]
GRDGPFKEKFCNDRRFARVEEETPSSDHLPPQGEVNIPMPSQDSGGMLRVIWSMESPIWGDQLVFDGEDIPDNGSDKVKPIKPQTVDKTVFVPFNAATNADRLPSDTQPGCD